MQESYSEFQVGNWMVYLPGGNYCTIKTISPKLELAGALENYITTIEHIGKIEITEHKLQVCGFDIQRPRSIIYFNDETCIALTSSPLGVYKLYKNEEEYCNVQFIHQVQNAYYEITGELLSGNLYGVRER
jgi:hypothetical protein